MREAPRIQSVPTHVAPGGSYTISGYLFNGMSEGAAYGDDQQSSTNFPPGAHYEQQNRALIARRTTTAAWPLLPAIWCLLTSMGPQPKSGVLASL